MFSESHAHLAVQPLRGPFAELWFHEIREASHDASGTSSDVSFGGPALGAGPCRKEASALHSADTVTVSGPESFDLLLNLY